MRQLLAEVERLKGEVERTRSAGPVTPNASRIAELEALLSQARADVGKFQALAEKNASAYQNAMARLFPALSLLSARCVRSVVSLSLPHLHCFARSVVVQSLRQRYLLLYVRAAPLEYILTGLRVRKHTHYGRPQDG